MGLAASQARLLVLTIRKSDLEYRAQMISNRKLLLAMQTQQIATDYSTALANRMLEFTYGYDSNTGKALTEELSIGSIYTENSSLIGNYRVVLADGTIAVASADQLPFTVKQNDDGSYSGTMDASTFYETLDSSTKVSYLAEALQGDDDMLTSYVESAQEAYDSTSSTDATKESAKAVLDAFNQPVRSTDGEAVTSRLSYLESILDTAYQYGVSSDDGTRATTSTTSGTTTANDFTEAMLTTLDADSKGNADTLKNLMIALSSDPTALALLKTQDETISDTALTSKSSNADFAQYITALNKYLVAYDQKSDTDKAADTNNTWLNGYVLSSTKAADFNTENNQVDTTSVQTYLDYLKTNGSTYCKTEAETVSDEEKEATPEARTSASSALETFIKNNATLAYNLIASDSSSFNTALSKESNITGTATESSATFYDNSTGQKYIILPSLSNTQFFQNALREGSLILQKYNTEASSGSEGWQTENWASSSIIRDSLYTADDAAAEAEYETQSAIIQSQDKMLDVELKQVETQQKACDNEIDSVKKILEKNEERSFKYMS